MLDSCSSEMMESLVERHELAKGRLEEISSENIIREPFNKYFCDMVHDAGKHFVRQN